MTLRRRQLRIALVLFGCLLTLNSGSAPQAVAAVSVIGDDATDSYIGDGGLILPGSFSGTKATRTAVASCIGCTWKMTVYCAADSDALCAHAVVTCPVGHIRFRVWFGRTTNALAVVGSVCWKDQKPLTRDQVDTAIQSLARRTVPGQRLGRAPSRRAITALPVIVWSGQPQSVVLRPMVLAGLTVRTTTHASWIWTWGDGSVSRTALPGAPYPSKQLSHQYRSSGSFRVVATSLWTASYTVAGLGPFAAGGQAVTQSGAMLVPVTSARGVLVL